MSAGERFSHYLPLLVFTACAIISVGITLGVGAALLVGTSLEPMQSPLLVALAAITLGAAASYLHLGRKERGLRAFIGLSHSWLSREAALALCFGAALAGAVAASSAGSPQITVFCTGAAAGLGLVLALAIGMLYRLQAQPGWSDGANLAAPVVSPVLLATALATSLAGHEPMPNLFSIIWVADLALFALRLPNPRRQQMPVAPFSFPHLRPLLSLAIPLRLLLSLAILGLFNAGLALPAAGTIAGAVLIDRLTFYAGARHYSPGAEVRAMKVERMRAAIR